MDDVKIPDGLCQAIKDIQDASGVSGSGLAAACGVSHTAIKHARTGYRMIGLRGIEAITDATGINPYVLSYLRHPKHFDKMSPEIQQAIINLRDRLNEWLNAKIAEHSKKAVDVL